MDVVVVHAMMVWGLGLHVILKLVVGTDDDG